MKLPVSLLRDFVQTDLSDDQLGDLLTMAGFELEGIDIVEGEAVLDIKVMANRGDGLSALGLAREVLAKESSARPTPLYEFAVARFPAPDTAATDVHEHAKIEVQTDACTRYAARVFTNTTPASSPEWLQKRLLQAGQRPLGLVVDLTNYVMMELGQPLHAFDLDTLAEHRIIVRSAEAGETLTTLNGVDHTLQPHHMMICDATKPVAVAGVMGGAETEVTDQTTNILLESAHFLNTSVRRTRKDLGLNTDASYRFERSVDPDGVVAALNRFATLYADITGQSALPGIIDHYPKAPGKRTVSVRLARANGLLGLTITPDEATRYLSALGFELTGTGDPFLCAVPSWRPDIEREEDVIEELARVHGYDKIPETPIGGCAVKGGVFGLPLLADNAREALLRSGLTQIMSHTLRSEHALDFTKDWRIGPRNPHSPEMSLMRDSLLPGLAEAALRNGGRNLRLFEIGRVFVRGEYQTDESPEIGLLITGTDPVPHWAGSPSAPADFWMLKGVVEELAGALGDHVTFDEPRDPDPRFHPTRQSGVLLDNNRLWAGTIGQIHPDIAESLGLPIETYLGELDLLVFAIQDNFEPALRPISRHPWARRDIAFVIDTDVQFRTVEQAILEAGGSDLERHWLFDVYAGKGIPEGKHSLAIALQLRRIDENLTDEAANEVRDRVVRKLESIGAELRG